MMKNLKTMTFSVGLSLLLLLLLGVDTAKAQPSEAQIRKDISGPRVVSITFGKPGTRSWSSTYKKYYWTRNYTAKLKTDTPKVFVIVTGYVAYDIYGSKFTFWREFVSSNAYEGIPNPNDDDLQKMVQKFGLEQLMRGYYFRMMIGQPESIKIADEPKFTWHTMNSVEFNIAMVYTEKPNVNYPTRRIKGIFRIRIYRDDVNTFWKNAISDRESFEAL